MTFLKSLAWIFQIKSSKVVSYITVLLKFLHLKSSFLFSQCIASLCHSPTLLDYYFKFSFDLKAILYIGKNYYIHAEWVPLSWY